MNESIYLEKTIINEPDGSITEVFSEPSVLSRYKPEYCEAIIAYFAVEHTQEVTRQVASPRGAVPILVDEANKLPTLAGFAASVGVAVRTLFGWKARHEAFREAMEVAQAHQEDMLINNALRGRYAAAPSIFAQKNILGWRDKIEHSGDEANPLKFILIPAKDPIGSAATTTRLPDLGTDTEAS